MTRRRLLTPEQAAELRHRFSLYHANRPKRIAMDMGIGLSALYNYVRKRQK